MGLEWNWRESSASNLLIAQRLSADYTLLKSSISENRRSSYDIRAPRMRCVVRSRDGQFLLQLRTYFGSVFRQLREAVRAQVAQAGAAICAGCARSSGSVWAMNVPGYRSSGAALCCGLIRQHRRGHPPPIVLTYALVVAEPCAWAGARRVARCNSFEIHSAWSVSTAVRTVLRKDARQVHAAVEFGYNENAHLICKLPNRGLPTGCDGS